MSFSGILWFCSAKSLKLQIHHNIIKRLHTCILARITQLQTKTLASILLLLCIPDSAELSLNVQMLPFFPSFHKINTVRMLGQLLVLRHFLQLPSPVHQLTMNKMMLITQYGSENRQRKVERTGNLATATTTNLSLSPRNLSRERFTAYRRPSSLLRTLNT